MKEKLAIIGALIMIIGTCFGIYFFAEDRYALSQDLKKTQQRLDYKILADQLKSVQERIWKIQDRCQGQQPKDTTVKEELRELEKSKGELSDKLKEMEKK